MGKELYSKYNEAKELGGLQAQIRLAVLTMLPGIMALEAPDSPENIDKFEEAMLVVRKEFSGAQKTSQC